MLMSPCMRCDVEPMLIGIFHPFYHCLVVDTIPYAGFCLVWSFTTLKTRGEYGQLFPSKSERKRVINNEQRRG